MDRMGAAEAGWSGEVTGRGAEAFDGVAAASAAHGWSAPSCLTALLDELSFGIALVQPDGRLIHASRSARAQLKAGRGLRLAGDVVEAEVPADLPALQRAIEDASAGRRSYASFGRGAGRLEAAFLPLDAPGESGAAAAIVFEKSAGSGALGMYFFARAYGLTRAEQGVLNQLCDGWSVIEASRNLGSSVHTARTHVRNILSKTGQRNLRDLMRRIGMLPPVGAHFASANAKAEVSAGPAAASTVDLPDTCCRSGPQTAAPAAI